MDARVLRRFIILLAALIVVMVIGTQVWEGIEDRVPGDYDTEMGENRLEDGLYDQALTHFNQALEEQPNHRGALMGKALVFIRQEQYEKALHQLSDLIGYLEKFLESDDATGRGVLAAAHANKAIILDRRAKYEDALDSYILALQVDEEAVEGPGIINKILYGSDRISSVKKRARYLYEQLQLPEAQRVLRISELDAMQRMHKP